jgi:LEA14-like dessication related protein
MKSYIYILLVLSLILGSCSLFKDPKFERLNEVKLNDLTPDQTNLDLSIVISNPNWFAITVKSLDIVINDKKQDKLGTVKMTKPLKMEKNSSDTVYFEIGLDTRKVAKMISHNAKKAEFVVNATAVANVFGISKKINLQQTQEINFTKILESVLPTIPTEFNMPTIKTDYKKTASGANKLVVRDPKLEPLTNTPKAPDLFKVLKTSISDIGLKETELKVKFMLFNPYGLSFTFRDFPSEIWINDKFAGRGKLAKPITFNENVFSAEGEMVFSLNNFNSLLLASKALVKKDMNYLVDGTLQVEGFGAKISKPFKFKGTVEIGKKDK